MSDANNIRKSLEIVKEATATAIPVGVDREKNVRVNLETLARQVPSKGKYDFNKGFMTFQDILDDPRPFMEKYRKESRKDTSELVGWLSNMKPEAKFTDKEKYLRFGFESRGYTNGTVTLVWWKEKSENLLIFAPSKDAHVQIRDFLQFYRVIR